MSQLNSLASYGNGTGKDNKMSALDELIEKENPTEIELCILWVADDAEKWEEGDMPYEHARNAAAELAAKDEQIAALRERVEKLEKVQVIAESVNQWLIQNELGSTAHQRQLAEALQEAQ